ncbi:MAG: sigma-54 dependent transcriptional regulator [Bacteroidales bacterium]
MPEKRSILVIDDDTYICNILKKYLEQNGYAVKTAYSGNFAKKIIDTQEFDLVLCDYRLPDQDGSVILNYVKARKHSTPVIIMTAYAEISKAVELIKSGAYDYITKPMQHEELLKLIINVLDGKKENVTRTSFAEDFIIGTNSTVNEIMQHVEVVAPTDMTVMIEGETGSGKEYIARAIHYASKRSKNPFIAVDCGAIPRELANSVLFGHIKGSFTGAVTDKTGYFQEAKGGTLFLDEVGNLPHENQVKILRALQEKSVTRIGENKPKKVDVRLIAAANDSLMEKVKAGEFREDLYHRLNGFRINIPPLRQRREDIMIFADHFIRQANMAFNRNVTKVDDSVRELLKNYYWHGNIRELQNVIKRVVLLSRSEVITPELLPEEIRFSSSKESPQTEFKNIINRNITDLKSATLVTEKEMIQNALEKTKNNKSKAARLLNIDRKTLYNKIKLYDLEF